MKEAIKGRYEKRNSGEAEEARNNDQVSVEEQLQHLSIRGKYKRGSELMEGMMNSQSNSGEAEQQWC